MVSPPSCTLAQCEAWVPQLCAHVLQVEGPFLHRCVHWFPHPCSHQHLSIGLRGGAAAHVVVCTGQRGYVSAPVQYGDWGWSEVWCSGPLPNLGGTPMVGVWVKEALDQKGVRGVPGRWLRTWGCCSVPPGSCSGA